MKRPNGEGTIKQRKNGTWEAQYVAGRTPGGKLIRKSIYGKTQKEVSQKLTAINNDLNNGLYISPDKATVGEWFDIWLSDYNKGVKQATRAQYDTQIRLHIKPSLGHIKLQKLTAPMIQHLYNEKLNTLSAKSIKNLHGVIHKGLNQAVLCKYIKYNPCLACDLPRVEHKEMRTITGGELKQFLEEIKGKPFADLFFVDVFTGLRQSEIIGLAWDCVDFEKGIIRVEKQLKRERNLNGGNEYRFDTLKNGKTRTVSPAPMVFSVLKRVRNEQRINQLKHGSVYNNEWNLVFTDEIGGHLHQPTVWAQFKQRVAAIGLPDVRFHDLRHSFATISIENGDDIKTVSENLGHATVAFTLDVYGHVSEKMRTESAERMEKYIHEITG